MSQPASGDGTSDIRHASSVAIDGHGVLITGASGTGKSALALELISRGAVLISDDLTKITGGDWPVLGGTGRMTGVIEARGVGLLRVPYCAAAPLNLIVDLDQIEPDRLPPRRHQTIMGAEIPVQFRVDAPHFPAAIWAMVKGGREA